MRRILAVTTMVVALCGVAVAAGAAVSRALPSIGPADRATVDLTMPDGPGAGSLLLLVDVTTPSVEATVGLALAVGYPDVTPSASTLATTSSAARAIDTVVASPPPAPRTARVATPVTSHQVVSCGGTDGSWRIVASAAECPGDEVLRIEVMLGTG